MRPADAMAFLQRAADLERDPARKKARRYLNLSRMRWLCARLDHPERGPAFFVHIAGTKGKGSTAAMTAALLRAAGLRTGLYTSPHVRRFTERIQVDGREITEAVLARLLAPHVAWARRLPRGQRPTYFEWVTGLALEHFRRSRCQAVVLEVGLGGRLDATNVIVPEVCAITRIDYDHMELLGRTLGKIAGEKAGILKPGVTCVVPAQPAEAMRVIGTQARRVGAPLIRSRRYAGSLAMPGEHQRENAGVALEMMQALKDKGLVRLSESAARRALAGVALPARIQILSRQPPFVVDGAHNPLSMRVLIRTLRKEFPGRRWTVVLGMASDKDLVGMLRELKGFAKRIVAVSFDSPRARPAEEIAVSARRAGIRAEAGSLQGLPWGPVCVTGSLWLAGEALGRIVEKKH